MTRSGGDPVRTIHAAQTMQTPEGPTTPHFTARLATRWCEEDNQGILNNAAYLTLFEEARLAWCRALDLMEGGSFPFVLAQANVRFVAPGRGGAEVDVALETAHVGNSSFVQRYRVTDAATGAVWSEAEALLVCVDAAGAKRPMSSGFRERVEASR